MKKQKMLTEVSTHVSLKHLCKGTTFQTIKQAFLLKSLRL